ncbi:OmpA family protein [Bacteroidia bacterium]|nr:OmpA family protein [Bacteroidia bacterium]
MKNGIILLCILLVTSCVSKKEYAALEADKAKIEALLAKKSKACDDEETTLIGRITELEGEIASQDIRIVDLNDSIRILRNTIAEEDAYIKALGNELDEQNTLLAKQLTSKNQTLQNKELQLNEALAKVVKEREELSVLRAELNSQNSRIKALELELSSKDSAANALKQLIQNALAGFSELDISVEERNGRVYLSLSNQLLFPSGSVAVNSKGKEALLKITSALVKQEDISYMVEGHTDNQPMNSKVMKDNWDLSVLRATSIVRLLTEDGGLNAKQVVASGRGETMPIASNESVDGRAKNRRTEIILTPKIEKIMEILNQN